jgi:hypothetical protein
MGPSLQLGLSEYNPKRESALPLSLCSFLNRRVELHMHCHAVGPLLFACMPTLFITNFIIIFVYLWYSIPKVRETSGKRTDYNTTGVSQLVKKIIIYFINLS